MTVKRWPLTIGELRRQIKDLPDGAKISVRMYNDPPASLSIRMEKTEVKSIAVDVLNGRPGATLFLVHMSILDSEDRPV